MLQTQFLVILPGVMNQHRPKLPVLRGVRTGDLCIDNAAFDGDGSGKVLRVPGLISRARLLGLGVRMTHARPLVTRSKNPVRPDVDNYF